LRHETLAWNPPHRFKHQRVADAARGELGVDRLLALVVQGQACRCSRAGPDRENHPNVSGLRPALTAVNVWIARCG
jgi:hypothetical protein